MKNYKKMSAVIVDLADKLDEVVAAKKSVPALAGSGISFKFGGGTSDSRFGISGDGTIGTGTGVSMLSVS